MPDMQADAMMPVPRMYIPQLAVHFSVEYVNPICLERYGVTIYTPLGSTREHHSSTVSYQLICWMLHEGCIRPVNLHHRVSLMGNHLGRQHRQQKAATLGERFQFRRQ